MTNDPTMDPVMIQRVVDHAAKQDAQWILVAVVGILVVGFGFVLRWLLSFIDRLVTNQTGVITDATKVMAETRETLKAMKVQFDVQTTVIQDATVSIKEVKGSLEDLQAAVDRFSLRPPPQKSS